MENLKVKVGNEAESKEAQGYFEDLGAVFCSGLERSKNVNFLFMNSGFVTACKLQENFDKSKCKEITLPELRDLAVLKRETLNDQVASAEEYREMISNAAGIGLTSVVVDIAQSCSCGASRNASSQGQSEFPLNNYELNHRVAKAFNAVRGTDLNEDDVNYLRELINLTISHYGERK